MKKSLSLQRGFSLIELIIVIVLVGIIATGSGVFINAVVDVWQFVSFRNDNLAAARVALNRMVQEIRMVRDKDSFVTALKHELSFVHSDGATITFLKNKKLLYRNADILAENVKTMRFKYYDRQYVETTVLSDIWLIDIRLIIKSGAQSKELRAVVYPRNVGLS